MVIHSLDLIRAHPAARRSGAPESPGGDRRVVPLEGDGLEVEAFPWSGGLALWRRDAEGHWTRLPLRR